MPEKRISFIKHIMITARYLVTIVLTKKLNRFAFLFIFDNKILRKKKNIR